jgi:hypothetical protein
MSRENLLKAAKAVGMPLSQSSIEEFLGRFLVEYQRLEKLPKKRKHYMVMVWCPRDGCPKAMSGHDEAELRKIMEEDGYTIISDVIEVEYTL